MLLEMVTPVTQPQPLPQSLTKSNFSNPEPALFLKLEGKKKTVNAKSEKKN
jgi:uncharacterized protein YcgL (UPF0745 family)